MDRLAVGVADSCVGIGDAHRVCKRSSRDEPIISAHPVRPAAHEKDLQMQAFRKRLMGFEPTTFCMASRRSSQLSYSRAWRQDSAGSRAHLRQPGRPM
jgi:hypothetical protein